MFSILIALFFLLNIATTAPIPPKITLGQYMAFLDHYYPDGSKYLFYTGSAEEQIREYRDATGDDKLVWFDFMFSKEYNDNMRNYFPGVFDQEPKWIRMFEIASHAMGLKASGRVKVFGSIDYESKPWSTYTRIEYEHGLLPGFWEGRVQAIEHMAPWATKPNDLMAIEDSEGDFDWENGYHEGDQNLVPRPNDLPLRPPPSGASEHASEEPKNASPDSGDGGRSGGPYGEPATLDPAGSGSQDPTTTNPTPEETQPEDPRPIDPDPDIHV